MASLSTRSSGLSSRPERRQPAASASGAAAAAPSLDVMAAQSSAAAGLQSEDPDLAGVSAMQDSQSSSSTNSPVPNDTEESDFFLANNDSQSSLGVPNSQDMQDSDGTADAAAMASDSDDGDDYACISPIHRLPNEILISIFSRLASSADQLHCMLTCKRWARNTVDLLWHRPACSSLQRHRLICQTLAAESSYFSYKDFIRRLNLSSIADKVNDGSVIPLAVCNRIERLTLTNCKDLTDTGLMALVENSHNLLALDISSVSQVTEKTIFTLAENCRRLQGLNVSGCTKISNEGMIKLAQSCKYIKRIKLNDCNQLTDEAVLAFALNCPNILEIDLHQCRNITNEPITSLLANGNALRELRLANCELIDDSAFLSLPPDRVYEHLRILDLTSCERLTDRAVARIVDMAPRLRNLVLAKCRNITDAAVYSIARLTKNLHYVHLGHCSHITDDAVKKLVHSCNRIRYIDLGCCTNLTDESVMRLATLPKLKRIGLVKCSSITDDSVLALARANQRNRQRKDADGNPYYSNSSLERVHLSYCTNLTIDSIIKLLEACPRLTHLSLTGVPNFLREDLNRFCRQAPAEFTAHQREVFCVFSGEGVISLRHHLMGMSYRDRGTNGGLGAPRPTPATMANTDLGADGAIVHPPPAAADTNFDDLDGDGPDDDDGIDEPSEIADDAPIAPPTQPAHPRPTHMSAHMPAPPPPGTVLFHYHHHPTLLSLSQQQQLQQQQQPLNLGGTNDVPMTTPGTSNLAATAIPFIPTVYYNAIQAQSRANRANRARSIGDGSGNRTISSMFPFASAEADDTAIAGPSTAGPGLAQPTGASSAPLGGGDVNMPLFSASGSTQTGPRTATMATPRQTPGTAQSGGFDGASRHISSGPLNMEYASFATVGLGQSLRRIAGAQSSNSTLPYFSSRQPAPPLVSDATGTATSFARLAGQTTAPSAHTESASQDPVDGPVQ